MVNVEYANAYSEVLEILKFISKEDYNKIPANKIELFKLNSNKEYKFTYSPNKTLDEQNVSKRAKAGDSDVVVCGGTENMSAAPFASLDARWGARMGDKKLVDTMIKDGLWDAYNNYHMGTTAENINDICPRFSEIPTKSGSATGFWPSAIRSVSAAALRQASFRPSRAISKPVPMTISFRPTPQSIREVPAARCLT